VFLYLAVFVASVFGLPVDTTAVLEHPDRLPPPVLVVADITEPAPTPTAPPAAPDPVRVPAQIIGNDFGAWNGIIACESGFNRYAHNAHSTASGLFQFLDTTWRWVTTDMGRPDLVALPGGAVDASVADQYAAAEHLRLMPGGGISHWVCGYRWNDGTRPPG